MERQTKLKFTVITSIVAMFLSIILLFGTTFAWFTDSVSNTNNIIKSGNVDVELWHTNKANETRKVDSKTVLFTDVYGKNMLWEPNASTGEIFTIKNVGSLALKYEMRITPASKTSTEDGKSLTDVLNLTVKGEQELYNEFFKEGCVIKGTLLAGAKANYTVDLTWTQTESDNDYNVAGGLELVLGINVVATQLNYENDGFGDQYDKDAKYPVVDAESFTDALEEGKDVKLEADICLTDTVNVAGDISIDLNGFNMDASAANSIFVVESGNNANIMVVGAEGEVKLGKNGLVDVVSGANANIEINGGNFISNDTESTLVKPVGAGEINIVLNDVNYKSTASNGYVLDCRYYDGSDLKVEINGGSFEATTGMLLPEGSSIKDASITAKNTKNMQPAIYAMGDMTIENCIIKAEKSHAVAVAGGATLTINNCEVVAGSDANALAFQVYSTGGTINVNSTDYEGEYGTTGKMKAGCVAIINIDGIEVYRK